MNKKETVGMEDFSTLYEKFGPMVLRRCRYILKDEESGVLGALVTYKKSI